MSVIEALDEEECYLWSLLSDSSGIDHAEFLWSDDSGPDGLFRAWDYQYSWWRCSDKLTLNSCGRSVGKSASAKLKAFAFPFLHPGQELVITAPEGVHLDALTDNVETSFEHSRLGKEMLQPGRTGIKHRPFHMNFANGCRIMGRIPQHDGKGVKGCVEITTPILTSEGYKEAQHIEIGDLVLNSESRWVPVTRVRKDINDCYEVRGAGSFPVIVSCDHRFYGAANEADSKHTRDFSNGLGFHDVEHIIDDQFYWATPTRFEPLEIPVVEFNGTATTYSMDEDFWWIVGLYLADGYTTSHGKKDTSFSAHIVSHPDNHARGPLLSKLRNLGLHCNITERTFSSADLVTFNSTALVKWLKSYFGNDAYTKYIPPFCLGMSLSNRKALLEGYLAGDGCWDPSRKRYTVGSASRSLAMGMQLLAQSVGLKVSSCYSTQPNQTHINGVKLKNKPALSWRFSISEQGHAYPITNMLVGKVMSVVPVGKQEIVNIQVEDGKSYLSGTIMSHNIHPHTLILDEGQDYPDAGWLELIETVKAGEPDSQWIVHGVTRGVRDYFYKFSQPGTDWTVFRKVAMNRPNWTDEERQSKIEMYGSKDNPDYRRNVLGLPGDATNPIFVLARLMAAVCQDLSDSYNVSEYATLKINAEQVVDYGGDILPLMDLPHSHKQYETVWIGADIGFTQDPTEILVFAEEHTTPKAPSRLKLISRVRLHRVDHTNQAKAILWLIDFYKPKCFAMDRTGLGLPLFQAIQDMAKNDSALRPYLDRIKGYNFSEKIIVELDDSIEIDEYMGKPEDAGIKRNVLEASTDILRTLVDSKRIYLPWDKEVIGEFQGQTYTFDKSTMDMYGRARRFSKGSFHTLDAARMAVLGWSQNALEQLLSHESLDLPSPVFMREQDMYGSGDSGILIF